MKGWMYILECSDGSYYTGSTIDLERRIKQHQNGEGSNHTKKRLPVRLLYTEEFSRIDEAFYREKQIQKSSRKKKEALINGELGTLVQLSKNYTEYGRPGTSASSVTGGDLNINSVTDEKSTINPNSNEDNDVSSVTKTE